MATDDVRSHTDHLQDDRPPVPTVLDADDGTAKETSPVEALGSHKAELDASRGDRINHSPLWDVFKREGDSVCLK